MIRYLFGRYRKAILGAVGAGVLAVASALILVSPGSITSNEWLTIVAAIVGGAGGPAVGKPNLPKRQVRADQRGQSALYLICVVIALILLVWLVLGLAHR